MVPLNTSEHQLSTSISSLTGSPSETQESKTHDEQKENKIINTSSIILIPSAQPVRRNVLQPGSIQNILEEKYLSLANQSLAQEEKVSVTPFSIFIHRPSLTVIPEEKYPNLSTDFKPY